MRIIALLAIRNEALYLERCLRHLSEQGLECYLIDNESEDDGPKIARAWLGRGLIGIESYPYPGFYDWRGILERKAKLAAELGDHWYIHHDADEIRQSPIAGQTLAEAIAAADAAGANAIDFLEFVFVPTDRAQDARGTDYVATLPHAYYFQPNPLHRVTAWRCAGPVDLLTYGGHRAEFPDRRLSPKPLILRHYPFLSWSHLLDKYGRERRYSDYEVRELGWHGRRACFDPSLARLPAPEGLIQPDREGWRTDRPWTRHPFLEG
ncbi:glycosyltransferase family 2 protein [Thermochromatium tepidum]|uniref:Glycosyltransferase family 2 protein n=1 Tax=Thermochromatium tepidum ATCC 43061 TaxID=316276 RepID=A0A6I6E6R1_THETI|nr:glycosyltransferase family 2 protein [Thermochromatium tepidum]QGU33542.1 glycosyltransferase family 2 protein [Thermochromatium tepidum ATCC 43061]